jgi:hypothetical protein
MTDGYKYIDVFYHLQTLNQLKVELNVSGITGKAGFSILFYSDQSYSSYLGEIQKPDLVLGSNVYESGLLQLGNMTLYAIGRLKLLQGSTVSLSSMALNDAQHIESGTFSMEASPLSFVESMNQGYVYHSSKLGKIVDPSFYLELQIETIVGVVSLEYLYYHDEACTMLESTQTMTPTESNNLFQVDTVNKYVVFRVKMLNGSRINLTSFKLQNVEQGILFFTTPAFTDEFAVVSETCFPANTLVKTDQGMLPIQRIVPHQHTIQGKSVVALTSTYCSDKELVLVRKDAFRKHYPLADTLISKKHKIYMKGKLKAAYRLVETHKGVSLVPYEGQLLFNVLLEEYGLMNVQGLMCETLHPLNPMATLFREVYREPTTCFQ